MFVSCQTRSRENALGVRNWPQVQGSGRISPSVPQAAEAVLGQELLTWEVDSSECRGQVLKLDFFYSLLYKKSLEDIMLLVRILISLSEETGK